MYLFTGQAKDFSDRHVKFRSFFESMKDRAPVHYQTVLLNYILEADGRAALFPKRCVSVNITNPSRWCLYFEYRKVSLRILRRDILPEDIEGKFSETIWIEEIISAGSREICQP